MRVEDSRRKTILLAALSDEYERRIMSATSTEAKSVRDISEECHIPIGACYRKVDGMFDSGLLLVERYAVTPKGKKLALFRDPFKTLVYRFRGRKVSVNATLDASLPERLRTRSLLGRPLHHPTLERRRPAAASRVKFEGENKCKTLIRNTSQSRK